MARGGRGGGRGGRADMPREQQISRKVSWLLRHGAGSEGLKLGKGGYVGVKDALNTNCLKSLKVTFPELKAVVASNDKKRFSMIPATALSNISEAGAESSPSAELSQEAIQSIPESDDPAAYLIRANQGHSIKVDTEGLLTPITAEANNIPSTVIHGTDEAAWKLILLGGGMRKMGRTHMHFASGLPAGFQLNATQEEKNAAPQVISGMRKSSTILIYVDIVKAMDSGYKWFVSENGVILTEGDEKGLLSFEVFEKVVDRRSGRVLMEGGVLPEGSVVDIEAWEKEVVGLGKRGGRGGRGVRGGRGGGRGGKAKVSEELMGVGATDV